MTTNSSKPQPTRLQVFGVVTFYMVSALVMVMVNKWTLNSTTLPLTFLWAQLIIAVVLIQGCAAVGLLKLPPLNIQLAVDLAAVITVNVVGLVFNTLCLKLVDASYFQVARGLVLPMTIALAALVAKLRPPTTTLACCALVTFGFLYGVSPSASAGAVNPMGVIYGVLSALCIAVHAILIKSSLRKVEARDPATSGVVNLAYLTNLGSAILLLPALFLTGEVSRWSSALLPSSSTTSTDSLRTFLLGSLITGLFGFLICIAGLLSIAVTSPVSHMFSSAVRSVLQTVLGVVAFGDVVTVPRGISIGLVVIGSAGYAFFKAQGQGQGGEAKVAAVDEGKLAEEGALLTDEEMDALLLDEKKDMVMDLHNAHGSPEGKHVRF